METTGIASGSKDEEKGGESMRARKHRVKAEKKSGKLEDRLHRKKLQGKKAASSNFKRAENTTLSADQLKQWERNMESMHDAQKGKEPRMEREVDLHTVETDKERDLVDLSINAADKSEELTERSSIASSGRSQEYDVIERTDSKADRAARLTEAINTARAKQLTSTPDGRHRRSEHMNTVLPGSGTGISTTKLRFDSSEIIYPPKDIYPPPIPLVHEVDLYAAARAFGIIRSCDVEWESSLDNGGGWRRTNRLLTYYEERGLFDHLEDERSLEYVGDACLGLLSRSLIIANIPGKRVAAYNTASSWLVSNACFAFIYEDSKLEEQREIVARLMMEESKKRELKEFESSITKEEFNHRQQMPLPKPQIDGSHFRKADFFEAYVGAVYHTFGFKEVSRWCTVLLSPWVEAIEKVPEFSEKRHLTPAGEAHKRRAQEEKRKAEEVARDAARPWWQKAAFGLFSRFSSKETSPSSTSR